MKTKKIINQEILKQIKSIASAVGLSGYYSSLRKEFKEDEDIVKAFKERREEL